MFWFLGPGGLDYAPAAKINFVLQTGIR